MYKYIFVIFTLIIFSGCAVNKAKSHDDSYKKEKGTYQEETRSRTYAEVAKVLDANKRDIFSFYNSYTIQTNSELEGKVVVSMTILSSGRVVESDIVESDIDDVTFLLKLLDVIDLYRFPEGNYKVLIVTYPIDLTRP